jgi:hypothetical protein
MQARPGKGGRRLLAISRALRRGTCESAAGWPPDRCASSSCATLSCAPATHSVRRHLRSVQHKTHHISARTHALHFNSHAVAPPSDLPLCTPTRTQRARVHVPSHTPGATDTKERHGADRRCGVVRRRMGGKAGGYCKMQESAAVGRAEEPRGVALGEEHRHPRDIPCGSGATAVHPSTYSRAYTRYRPWPCCSHG